MIDTGSSGFRPIAWAEVHGQSRGVDPWDSPIAYRPIFMCATSWVAKMVERQIMTDDQVNLVVQHLCEQLHLALRLKGSEAHPPNAKDIGFDPASVRTVLLTGLRSAGVTIHHEAAGASEEPPWS